MRVDIPDSEINSMLLRIQAQTKYSCQPRGYNADEWAVFNPEIEKWTDENIRGKLCIDAEISKSNRNYFEFWIDFENDSDAILFKMRWL